MFIKITQKRYLMKFQFIKSTCKNILGIKQHIKYFIFKIVKIKIIQQKQKQESLFNQFFIKSILMGNQQGCCPENENYNDLKEQNSIHPIKYGQKIYLNEKGLKNSLQSKSKTLFTGNNVFDKKNEGSQKNSKHSFDRFSQKSYSEQLNKVEKYEKAKNNNDQFIQYSRTIKGEKWGRLQEKSNPEKWEQLQIFELNNRQKSKDFSQNLMVQAFQRTSQLRNSEKLLDKQKNYNTSSKKNSEISYKKTGSILQINDLSESGISQSKINRSQLVNQQITIKYLPIVSRVIARQKPFQKQFLSIPQQNIRKIRINSGRDVYKGQLNEIQKPHGFGILVKENGNGIFGKFINGVLQGEIFCIFNDGSYYKGQAVEGQAHDPNGQFFSVDFNYRGGIQNNCFHGICEQLGDDYYFKGQYENHKRKNGILSWKVKLQKVDQKHIHTNNQEQMGQQTQVIDDIPKIRDFNQIPKFSYFYEGSFDADNQFTGQGVLKQPQGTYKGNFQNGCKKGKGQYFYQSKLKYVGEYQNDTKNGYGVLWNCDQTKAYQGEWKNGLPNGKGISYDLQGRKTQAQFILGLNSSILSAQELKKSKKLN